MSVFETILMWIISPTVGMAAGAWGGWFFGRKRQRIDTIDAATDTFNKIIHQLRNEIGVYQQKNDEYAQQVQQQSQQIKELTDQVKKLSEEVESLRCEKKENALLKRKIDKYTKLLDINNIEY